MKLTKWLTSPLAIRGCVADVKHQGWETPLQRVWITTSCRLLALHTSVTVATINRPLNLCRITHMKLLLLLATQRPFHPTHNGWVSVTWLQCEGSTNSVGQNFDVRLVKAIGETINNAKQWHFSIEHTLSNYLTPHFQPSTSSHLTSRENNPLVWVTLRVKPPWFFFF